MHRTVASSLLLSSLLFTAAANASPSGNDAPASTPRVSTGITPPVALNSLVLAGNDFPNGRALPADTLVTVSFTVDESGHPRDIQLLKGADAYWNSQILSALENLRYRPATLDNQPVEMTVNMNINLIQ